ncbi:hypothetical protein VTO42DRAFT_3157 [Malbranchea cinnamomea]
MILVFFTKSCSTAVLENETFIFITINQKSRRTYYDTNHLPLHNHTLLQSPPLLLVKTESLTENRTAGNSLKGNDTMILVHSGLSRMGRCVGAGVSPHIPSGMKCRYSYYVCGMMMKNKQLKDVEGGDGKHLDNSLSTLQRRFRLKSTILCMYHDLALMHDYHGTS